jgi:hypothetical protein
VSSIGCQREGGDISQLPYGIVRGCVSSRSARSGELVTHQTQIVETTRFKQGQLYDSGPCTQ